MSESEDMSPRTEGTRVRGHGSEDEGTRVHEYPGTHARVPHATPLSGIRGVYTGHAVPHGVPKQALPP